MDRVVPALAKDETPRTHALLLDRRRAPFGKPRQVRVLDAQRVAVPCRGRDQVSEIHGQPFGSLARNRRATRRAGAAFGWSRSCYVDEHPVTAQAVAHPTDGLASFEVARPAVVVTAMPAPRLVAVYAQCVREGRTLRGRRLRARRRRSQITDRCSIERWTAFREILGELAHRLIGHRLAYVDEHRKRRSNRRLESLDRRVRVRDYEVDEVVEVVGVRGRSR